MNIELTIRSHLRFDRLKLKKGGSGCGEIEPGLEGGVVELDLLAEDFGRGFQPFPCYPR